MQWIEGGQLRSERTSEPGAVVASLVARLGEPEALEVVRPSLEDVYLQLVGDSEAVPEAESGSSLSRPAEPVETPPASRQARLVSTSSTHLDDEGAQR